MQKDFPANQSPSDRSDPSPSRRLRPSGGYRSLITFRLTTVIYDATVTFCERFLNPRSRTVDQMTQAARSGRQNIAEGSRASGTSTKSEIHLVNVARASLDELLLDYEDFLRQRNLEIWSKSHPLAQKIRGLRFDPNANSENPYTSWLNSEDSSVVANTLICLIHQANFLLDRQILALEKSFISEGGYSENLATARIAQRKKHNQNLPSNTSTQSQPPSCPSCGKPMAYRTATRGPHKDKPFWGCTEYPNCNGIRPV